MNLYVVGFGQKIVSNFSTDNTAYIKSQKPSFNPELNLFSPTSPTKP